MAPTKLHNIKLKQTNYDFFTMVWRLSGGLDTSQRWIGHFGDGLDIIHGT